MELFKGSAEDFDRLEDERQLVDRLRVSFLDYYNHEPSLSEQNSWRYSLHALSSQMRLTGLRDHGVILEMQLPLTSLRLDCMLRALVPRVSRTP